METPAEQSADELIRAGRDQLRTLQLKRRLARYEVALAELQAAVDKAERGEPQPLQRWLASADPQWVAGAAADQLPETARRRLRSHMAAIGNSTVVTQEPSPTKQLPTEQLTTDQLSTEPSRSEQLPTEVVPTENGPTVKGSTGKGSTEKVPTEKGPTETMSTARTTAPAAEPSGADLPGESRLEPPRPKSGGRRPAATQRRAGRPVKPDADSQRTTDQQPTRQLLAELPAGEAASKPRGRGVAATVSLLAHALLLAGLLAVTLKHPSQPRLSLQAAQSPADEVPIELIQDLEWSESDVTLDADSNAPAELEAVAEGLDGQLLLDQLADGIGPVGELLGGPPSLPVAGAGESAELAGVQFFGAQAAGNNVVYVVDSSGSMRRGGAFDIARQELLRSIAALKPHQRYYIFFFHNEINAQTLEGDQPESTMVYPTPENLQATLAWVQRIEMGPGENPKRVLMRAFALDPDAIFLLTDGEFPDWVVTEFLPEANRIDDFWAGLEPKVPIHAIAFAANKLEDQLRMQRLAAENAGQYRLVPVELPTRRSAARQ